MFLFLAGCSFKKKFAPTESPCLDGTYFNIDYADCDMFYFGINDTEKMIKLRCTLTNKESWWTKTSFYGVHHNYKVTNDEWVLFCQDRYMKVYVAPTFDRKASKNDTR